MSDRDEYESLKDRLIGKRYYNQNIDEAFTVVDVTPPLATMMYDDGTHWDEIIDADTIGEEGAEKFGVSEHGLDDANYIPLGTGLDARQMCDVGEHDYWPAPDDVWPDGPPGRGSSWENKYTRFARCKKCGLSPNYILTSGQPGDYQWWCSVCDDLHSLQNTTYQTVDYPDVPVCPDCVEDAGGIEERFPQDDEQDGDAA